MGEPHVKVAVPMTAAGDARAPLPATESPAEIEARLDEALQMTFPASDPVAVPAQR